MRERANLTVDLVLNNAKAYLDGKIVDCSFAIENGKIFKIGKESNMPQAHKKTDLKNLLVLPGLIDVHVHLRDEGKAYKEDFYSGTAAAAAGGITTVLDMPNNDPVTMSAEILRNRMEIAKKKILVNVGFYSEFPKRTCEIEEIAKEGAVAFKLFMGEKVGGLDIDDDYALLEAFKVLKDLNVLVAAHAEDKATLEKAQRKLKNAKVDGIEVFLRVHGENAEVNAIKRLLKIFKQTRNKLHICHVSTENGLKEIVKGKKSGLPLTCEATPHHLLLSTTDLRQTGPLALTTPPVREKNHAIALWREVKAGWIDVIASDHAPHTLEEKENELKVGISGLETMLPLLLTEVKHERLSIADVVRLMAEKPAEIFNLRDKGSLREGNDADLTVIDLDSKYKIDASKFHSKAKFSPFDGRTVEGKPVKTFVKGQLVMDDSYIVAEAGSGEIIRSE